MLIQNELNSLKDFVDRSQTGTPYLRRAQITLLSAARLSNEDIALQLNIPVTRVRHWQRVFNRLGVEAFPDEILNPQPLFSSDDPITTAGAELFSSLLARILVLEPELESSVSVKSVHETRKNIRRLRTALQLLDPYYNSKKLKRFQKRFRKEMRRLSRLRDHHVFLLKLQLYMEDGLSRQSLSQDDRLAYQELEQYWRESKSQVDKKAKDYLEKGKYRKLLQDFGLAIRQIDRGTGKKKLESTVIEIAPALIAEKAAAVHQFNDVTAQLSLARLHALRIQMKELRYTMEFFEPLMGQAAAPLLQVIKELLSHLGDLNDARVHLAMLGGDEDCASIPAAAYYLEILQGELNRLQAEFPTKWAHFEEESWREGLNIALAGIVPS